MTRHLIFGGSGFIGAHLYRYLVQREPSAIIDVADIREPAFPANYHFCDVRQPIILGANYGPGTVIYNLAAVHTTPGHADVEYFATNILGAESVCNFARAIGAHQIMFTSSIAPYGASEDRKTEDSLPMPMSPYGISKLVAEKIHMIWQAGAPNRHLSIIRPGVVFGLGEGGNFTRLYHALRRGVFAYPGRRDTVKAGIYVKDLVRVMIAMVEAPRASLQLYNGCFKEPPRIDTIVQCMQRTIGDDRHIPTIPPFGLKLAARILSLPGFSIFGFHPDRVTKLMVSTRVDGSRLDSDYPLRFSIQTALDDWWRDCAGRGLF